MKRILILLTTLSLLGGCTGGTESTSTGPETEKSLAVSTNPACAANENVVFVSDEDIGGYGSFTFTGNVVSLEIPKPFADENERATVVLLSVRDDGSPAFKHYDALVRRGNTINSFDPEGNLLFNLGALENAVFVSSAEMDESTKSKILSSIGTNEMLKLKMTASQPRGVGVTEKFSYACKIELQ